MNDAGITRIKPCVEQSLEEYTTVMSTNVEAPYHLSQLAYPFLKASGNGSIVFISSVAGSMAHLHDLLIQHLKVCIYCILDVDVSQNLAKITMVAALPGAINQITKNLACEWAKDNIRTNNVSPWGVKTTMAEQVNYPLTLSYCRFWISCIQIFIFFDLF